jgi:hypothetical protein
MQVMHPEKAIRSTGRMVVAVCDFFFGRCRSCVLIIGDSEDRGRTGDGKDAVFIGEEYLSILFVDAVVQYNVGW